MHFVLYRWVLLWPLDLLRMQNTMLMFKASMFTTKIALLRYLFLLAYIAFVLVSFSHSSMRNRFYAFVYYLSTCCQPFWRIWNAAGSGGRGVIGIVTNLWEGLNIWFSHFFLMWSLMLVCSGTKVYWKLISLSLLMISKGLSVQQFCLDWRHG